MRYLGLDLGTRTCGVAVSDSMGVIATSVKTVRFFEKDLDTCLEEILKIADEKNVEAFVLGLPLTLSGTESIQTKYVLDFKKMLEDASNKQVFLQDERLTSVEVGRMMSEAGVKIKTKKEKVDTLAATLILQAFLDTNNN